MKTPKEHPRRDAEDEYNFDELAEEVAKERGLLVVYPNDSQLQIDIDSEDAFDNFKMRRDEFDIDEGQTIVTPSASGLPNRHITITFEDRKFSEGERIAMQFALGSDPVRERLNILRLWQGIPKPTRLFERP